MTTRVLAVIVFAGAFCGQLAVAGAAPEQLPGPQIVESTKPSGNLPALPPAPRGKSTVIGGEITGIDRVRDELTLKVFGQSSMKILFDERTLVYLDGKRIPVRELTSSRRASVQTTLDGTKVFAVSIHILSQSPEGEFRGSVLNYNPETRALTVSAAHMRDAIQLRVPGNTPVFREGQHAFSSVPSGTPDLVKGALVSVTFEPGKDGRGVANKIVILAIPGAEFLFSGNLSSLDMHTGTLVLVDPRDDQSYQILFDSARFPASRNLHEGDYISVSATYDGAHFRARSLTAH
ncbi:MAG TPA: hypothetical protein VMV57_06835 [Terracidiphilus sp.]|nr:hypothetical protein [Terracidiphilus sp.]